MTAPQLRRTVWRFLILAGLVGLGVLALGIRVWGLARRPALPRPPQTQLSGYEVSQGAIIRGSSSEKRVALVFTGHEHAECGETILAELARHKGKASFFLTGDFLANSNHSALVQKIVAKGHYLGPHSDKHLLYCAWEPQRRTLVQRQQFVHDLNANIEKIGAFGVPREQVRFFLPPYEHYNSEIAEWSREQGLTLINFTPGTRSAADYTGESDKNFVSTDAIFDSIVAKEKSDGLNGFILLLHTGSGPGRTDKFARRFGELLDYLAEREYAFVRVDHLLTHHNSASTEKH